MTRRGEIPADTQARIEAVMGRIVELREENARLREQVTEASAPGGKVVPLSRKGARR